MAPRRPSPSQSHPSTYLSKDEGEDRGMGRKEQSQESWRLTFTEHVLGARYGAESFACIISFNPHSIPLK